VNREPSNDDLRLRVRQRDAVRRRELEDKVTLTDQGGVFDVGKRDGSIRIKGKVELVSSSAARGRPSAGSHRRTRSASRR